MRAGRLVVFLVLCGAWAAVPPQAWGISVLLKGPQDNKLCIVCHRKRDLQKRGADGRVVSLYVDEQAYNSSVHRERSCTDCHSDIKEVPHRKQIQRVNCSKCHYIGNISGAPSLERYAEYRESVHKLALERGNPNAPTCQDCHGAHDVTAALDPSSRVNHFNIPKTCGRCHLETYSLYRDSVHGEALDRGNADVAVCTSCHGEHSIRAVTEPASSVFPTEVSGTCSRCHAAEGIMARYGLSAKRVKTYRESYHGIANRYGSTVVANCASCHGSHSIRRSTDPKSSINRANIPKTCGSPGCHPRASRNFAKGRIHVEIRESPPLFWVNTGFKWLTVLTMLALVAHIALDVWRKMRVRKGEREPPAE